MPEQWAACPMKVSVPSVNTKFAVHWAPSVKVMTPGVMSPAAAVALVAAAPARAATAAAVAARMRDLLSMGRS